VDGCQSWKLALETSANFVATHAGFQREFPASVSWALWLWCQIQNCRLTYLHSADDSVVICLRDVTATDGSTYKISVVLYLHYIM